MWRGGINLYARSAFFGGYSGLIVDPSGKSLLAISDAGTWFRASIDYDGRKLKGLRARRASRPMLGKDGKPLATDAQRDAEGIALADGDTAKGSAYVSFSATIASCVTPSAASASDRLTARWRFPLKQSA